MRHFFLCILILPVVLHAQSNVVTYAGGAGNEVFNDVVQISNGNVLVIGAADALDWLPNGVIVTTLTHPGITNNQGTGRTPFILRLDSSLQNVLGVYALAAGAAEDLRFIKSTNAPGEVTGDLFLSGTTAAGQPDCAAPCCRTRTAPARCLVAGRGHCR